MDALGIVPQRKGKGLPMNKIIHLDPAQVPAQLRRSYSGKHFKAEIVESVTIPSYAGNWCEGSRDTYELVQLSDGNAVAASDNISAPWDHRTDRKIDLRPGFAVVRHSIFCGKDMGLTFYMLAENAAALLPPPAAELSSHQKIVLNATASLKSSYNGQDRYQMSAPSSWEAQEIKDAFPTRAQWEQAKAELIASGHLNKAGAITTKGRNAR